MRRCAALIVFALLIAACGDDDGGLGPSTTSTTSGTSSTVTTATTSATTTTTTLPVLADLPSEANVSSARWSGSFALSSQIVDTRAGISGTLSGSFVAPETHEVSVRGETSSFGEDDELVERETLEFRAVAFGEAAIIEEDGDIDEEDLEDELDDRFGVMSTASGSIIPTPEMLTVLSDTDGDVGSVGDRPVNLYAFEGESADQFVPLFAYSLSELGEFEDIVVRIAVDPATGAALEASLDGTINDGDSTTFDIEMAFTITSLNDPDITIEFPGLAVDGWVEYEDPDGLFVVSHPVGWEVDNFGDLTEFSTAGMGDNTVLSVMVDDDFGGDGSLDAYVDSIFEDAPEDTTVDESTIDKDGLTWRVFDLTFSDEDSLYRGLAWATVSDGTGYALALVGHQEAIDGSPLPDIVARMFDTFVPAP